MRARTLWIIIIVCNTIDLLYSYAIYKLYIAIPGGVFEVNPIARVVESIGTLVLPDLISLKIIGLSLIYWLSKFYPSVLKIMAIISILLVIYELFILPFLAYIV